jgi:hypothetical protein
MIKRLLTLICILFSTIAFAQSVLQGINYQDIARDSTGSALVAEALTIQFSVISDTLTPSNFIK